MSRRLRVVVNTVLILTALVCAGVLLWQRLQWRDSAQAAKRAEELAHAAPAPTAEAGQGQGDAPAAPLPDPAAEELLGLDLDALRAVNPDVAAWLAIPGGDIAHPVCRGPDNDYYLHHTWERKWNGGGAIFLDCRSRRDFEGFHTIIYGHRMRNGTMFGPLHRYAEQDFWAEHPYIYLADGECVRRYAVFAAWEPSVTSAVYAWKPDSEAARRELIDQCLGGSVIDTGVVPGPEDKLLTLSTCTASGHETRWVVQARLEAVYPAQE